MKSSLNFSHRFKYLNSLSLSILSVLTISDVSSANPLCYIIDVNGKQVNLSFLCTFSKSTSPTPPTTPIATPTQDKPSTNNLINPPAPSAITPTTTPSTDNVNPPEKEVDKTKLPAAQRAIPLLQNQQTPSVNN
ncbi:hypothetical protein [Geminocystis sp.]|uniref:hypothetical protein n=1 Tax=Geminocystis sp. TaxID=2664100 RepID=UPI00359353AA